MIIIRITLCSLMFTSCINNSATKDRTKKVVATSNGSVRTYVDSLQEMERLSTNVNYDTLGTLISKISFDVKTQNLADYETGEIPWIRVDSPQLDIKNLKGKDEIVVSQKHVTIIIDYPLSSNYKFDLDSRTGFTRARLINEISKHYYLVYDEEESTATIKTVPLKQRKIYNRNITNGKYGIWGHDVGDLVLDEIHVYKNDEGKIFLVLQLES